MIDGTFGAGGHTRAILERRHAGDRHRPRPERGRGRLRACRGSRGPARRWSRIASPISTRWRRVSGMTRSMACCSISASRRCSSIRASAASRSAMTDRSTCAWAATARARPIVVNTRVRARSRAHHCDARRGALRARRSRARSSRRAARRRSRPRARSPPPSERCLRQRPGEIHPATRTFQALRIFVNDELGELVDGAGGGRAHAEARRPARRDLVPLAGRPHREDVLRRARPRRRRLAPSRPKSHAPRRASHSDRSPVVADDAEIAENPRARSAKLRAGERTDAPPLRSDLAPLLPRLPALDDVMRRPLMLLRILHLVVIAALVLAAADVYKIKYESTLQAQGVVKMRADVRREQDAIEALRAEWAKLERPDRVQDPDAPPPAAQAARSAPVRRARPPARAAEGDRAARHRRSDRRGDRGLEDARYRDRHACQAQTAALASCAEPSGPRPVHRRASARTARPPQRAAAPPPCASASCRRCSTAKSTATRKRAPASASRSSLFASVYGVIAGRLVLHALTPDSHVARRGSAAMRSRPRGPTSRPQRRRAGDRCAGIVAVRRAASRLSTWTRRSSC